jgi:biotin carboxylase
LSAVILHRGSLVINPYHEWLADYDGDLFLLASQDYLDDFREQLPASGGAYVHTESFRDFDRPEPVDGITIEIARKYGVKHIVACQELVLQRAAALRETLGLPGQTPSSALAFRDKLVMKQHAQRGGVPVARHRRVTSLTEVREFAREFGFPIVLKPRDGAGSIDAQIIRHEAGLAAVDVSRVAGKLVESYVPGTIYHVNGVVVNGRTVLSWPSRYANVLAEFTSGASRVDVTLEADDPLAARLVEFNERVLAALPGPEHFGFHTEIFHTPDDQFVLCEIASRSGGAAVKEIIRAAFDVDITRTMVRAQLGLPLGDLLERPMPAPAQMAGQLLLMKRPGRVRSLPDGPHFPWVRHYRMLVEPGQQLRRSNASSDMLGSMVVVGPDRATCQARLEQAREYFDSEVVIEESA